MKKLIELVELAREYFDDKNVNVKLKMHKDIHIVEIENCKWIGRTFEEAVNDAIDEIAEKRIEYWDMLKYIEERRA